MIERMSTSILVLLAGCVEPDYRTPQPPVEGASALPVASVSKTDEIVQVTTPKVDALFVVDNSGTMWDEQILLTENFPYFISFFLGSGLDYHIGVTSTDMQGVYGPNGTKGRLRSVAGYRYISADTPNQTQIFTGMVSMGTSGSGTEQGTTAVWAALSQQDDANAGFYRDDASLHSIVVSDEDNTIRSGEPTLHEFIDWYGGLKRDAADRTFSAIINDRGHDYATVARQIGGIVWDIGRDDWQEVLVELGLQAAGLKREYFLSELPVPGTISVRVAQPIEGSDQTNVIDFEEALVDAEGNVLNEDPELTWRYIGERNSIRFTSYIPPALSRIFVTYDLLAATQDAPVTEDVSK